MKELKVKKHGERPDLTGEHPLGDLGQLILLIAFLGLWAVDTFFIQFQKSSFVDIPVWLYTTVGVIFLLSGFYFARNSMKLIFGKKHENPKVVNENVYKKVRHPMYLGALLFYLGMAILMCSLPLFIMFMVIFFFYNYIARHEEKLLLNRFGNDYREYMKNTKRWMPKV
jgi:protein-S-isoprenylcysteine O-methyltransferase Ste14